MGIAAYTLLMMTNFVSSKFYSFKILSPFYEHGLSFVWNRKSHCLISPHEFAVTFDLFPHLALVPFPYCTKVLISSGVVFFKKGSVLNVFFGFVLLIQTEGPDIISATPFAPI